MLPVSAVILTKNEEKNILDCLESIKDFNEIIVLDDFSEDRTVEVIRNYSKSVKVISRRVAGDFAAQRNYGLSKAANEWVFFIDADERLTPELRREIKGKIGDARIKGFLVKRRDVMWGKVLMHGEVGQIKLLRLASRNAGKWKGKVHEVWGVQGEAGYIESPMIHFPHQSIKEFLAEINMYSSIKAQELYNEGCNVNVLHIIIYPLAKLIQNYIVRRGFLDGIPGLVFAIMMSFHSFQVRSKLWLLKNK